MDEITAEMIERGRGQDPRASSQRRKRGVKVQEAREKLTTSDTGHRGCDVGLLRAYASARLHSAGPASALIAMVAGLTRYWMDTELELVWTTLAFSSLLLCYVLAKRLDKLSDAEINVVHWRSKLVAAEFAHGLVWASMAGLLLQANDPNANAFVVAMLMLAAAFNTMVTATIPIAVYATITPISIAIVACLRVSGLEDTTLSLLALVGAAQVFFVVLAKRFHHVTREGLFFRIEKDDLIGELEQAKANSDEARRRAEEANLAKSRFLATMSHELRTPLNAILGFSEIMKGEVFGPIGNEHYKEYVGDIHNSGTHLLNLINEILDLSRIEAGRYTLNEEAVTLAHVVDDCHHLMKLKAKTKNISIHMQTETGLPKIWADERAIRQIVLNLLSNAVKFTPTGGDIWIKMGWTAGGGQYVLIRDNGPGIPEEEIPIVLSAFGQGSLAIKTAEQGTGLGLPIVQALMHMHGGTFDLRSKLREGTEVTITFPPTRVMEVMPAIVDPAAGVEDTRAGVTGVLRRRA
jgi:two-component system cell cycle sensor histidine kinase PleC